MKVHSATAQSPADQAVAASATACAYGPSCSTESFICRALNVFIDSGLVAPEEDHLKLITQLALKAREFFFASALFLPEQSQLDYFFDEFVRLCATPTPVLSCGSVFDGGLSATCASQTNPRIE